MKDVEDTRATGLASQSMPRTVMSRGTTHSGVRDTEYLDNYGRGWNGTASVSEVTSWLTMGQPPCRAAVRLQAPRDIAAIMDPGVTANNFFLGRSMQKRIV